jgi:hypothetical protein
MTELSALTSFTGILQVIILGLVEDLIVLYPPSKLNVCDGNLIAGFDSSDNLSVKPFSDESGKVCA